MQTERVIDYRMTPSFKREIVKIVDNRINEVHVTKEDFSELKEIVRELGKSQKELAEAQKRTEIKVGELAEAQKESQKETSRLDKTMQELAEAQKRTEIKVEELAEAQKETQYELHKLVGEHKETRKQLGGLSNTVGYALEDRAYTGLPELLKRDYEIIVQGRLKRGYMPDKNNKMIEVNIIGEAIKDDKRVTIIGEGKSQLSKNDIDRFIKIRLEKLTGMFDEVFPVLVAYMISEFDVEEYARKKGIALYYSYDF
ncbi:MAG: chordopoxvirus fusion protein [Candidatus Desantisbacteria bacterium]